MIIAIIIYFASIPFNMWLHPATTHDYLLGPFFIPIALRMKRREKMALRHEILRRLLIRMENNDFHERYERGICSEVLGMSHYSRDDVSDLLNYMKLQLRKYNFASRTPNSVYWFSQDADGMRDRIAFTRVLITKTDR